MLTASAFCVTFSAKITWIAMGPFLVINAFHYSPFMLVFFRRWYLQFYYWRSLWST